MPVVHAQLSLCLALELELMDLGTGVGVDADSAATLRVSDLIAAGAIDCEMYDSCDVDPLTGQVTYTRA